MGKPLNHGQRRRYTMAKAQEEGRVWKPMHEWLADQAEARARIGAQPPDDAEVQAFIASRGTTKLPPGQARNALNCQTVKPPFRQWRR